MGMNLRPSAACLFSIVLATSGLAQDCSKKTTYSLWLRCRIDARVQNRIANSNSAIKLNATNGARQQDSPAVAGKSNSLVDQSSASDLVNLALNLAKLSPNTASGSNTNSVSVTTSAYALYAAANYHDPLDPEFYSRNRQWRRFFVTLGQDVPNTTSNTSTANVDPHANRNGTVVGFKAVIWNGRDITDPKNMNVFDKVLVALGHAGTATSRIDDTLANPQSPGRVSDVYTRFASLTANENQQVDKVIDQYIDAFMGLNQVAESAFQEIKNKRQWTLSYSADIRDSQGYNQHNVQSVLDWGITPRLNWTSNAGVDFYDAKSFGRNRQGGSTSTELQFRVTEDPKQIQPILLSFSGYGQWLTNVRPVYKAQGKLTIPLGQKTGVSLPISVTYASRTDLIQEAHTEAKFGFTFDAAKIAAALLPSSGK